MNEELKVIITAKIAPLQSELKKVSKSLDGVSKNTAQMTSSMDKSFKKSIGSISKLKVAIGAMVYAAVKVGKSIGAMGAEAISVDNQVKSLSRTMGSSAGEFANWAATTAAQFGVSEKAAVEFGGQFSSIISRTEKSGEAVKDLTQDFLKLGATIAGNTKFDVDDVMGRLRSGLSGRNEAIEDLGIEVKPETIKGTLAYTQAVGRMGVEWDKMTAKQQSQVRMQAILEQGNQRFGNGLTGVAQQMAIFKASVENVKLAWGRAFAPIVQFVIPVLQRLVGWLSTAALYVRALLSMFFKFDDSVAKVEKSSQGMAQSIGEAAGSSGAIGKGFDKANKAAKKLQKTLFGFDVIHNISEPVEDSFSDLGGAGAGGGVAGGMPETSMAGFEDGVAAFDEIGNKITEIQEKIQIAIDKIKQKMSSILPLLLGLAAGIGILWFAFSGSAKLMAFFDLMAAKGGILGGVFKVLSRIVLELLAVIIKGIVYFAHFIGLGAAPIWAMVVAAILTVIAVVTAMAQAFRDNTKGVADRWTETWDGIKETLALAWDAISGWIDVIVVGLMLIWNIALKPLWDSFVNFVASLMNLFMVLWDKVLKPFIDSFIKILKPIITGVLVVIGVAFVVLSTAISIAIQIVMNVIAAVIDMFVWWLDKTQVVRDGIHAVFSVVAAWITEKVNVMITFLKKVMKTIQDWWESTEEARAKISEALGEVTKWMGDKIEEMIGWVVDLMTSIAEWWKSTEVAREKISEAIGKVAGWIGEKIMEMIGFFTGIGSYLLEKFVPIFSGVWEGAKAIFGGFFEHIKIVIDMIKGVFKGIMDFIVGVFTGDWSKAWDGVVGIFRSLFEAIPKIFKNVWDTIMKLFSAGGNIFKGFASSVADIFKKLVNSLIRGINTVIGAPFKALNKAFDRFKGISILGMKPFSWLPSIGIPAIPQFATGGFPEDGLFHANSRELVGKFSNGKTAVANNDQIISGVSTGVANAVRQVLLNTDKNGSQPINLTVQIGSNQIAKEVINAIDDYTMKTGMTFKTI